jgi:hypothetical protein
MSGDKNNPEINFEQDMPIIAAATQKYGIAEREISRRTLLACGCAISAGLLLGQMGESAGAASEEPSMLTARTFSSLRHKTHDAPP